MSFFCDNGLGYSTGLRSFLNGLVYAVIWSDHHMPMCRTIDRGTKISDSDSGVLILCSLSFTTTTPTRIHSQSRSMLPVSVKHTYALDNSLADTCSFWNLLVLVPTDNSKP